MFLTLSGSEKLETEMEINEMGFGTRKGQSLKLEEPGGGREQRAESVWNDERGHTRFWGKGPRGRGHWELKRAPSHRWVAFAFVVWRIYPWEFGHIVYPLWVVGGLGFWDWEGHFGDFENLMRLADVTSFRSWESLGEDGRWGCSVGDSLEWRCSVPKVSCELLRMPPFVISLPALIFFYVFFLGQLII